MLFANHVPVHQALNKTAVFVEKITRLPRHGARSENC